MTDVPDGLPTDPRHDAGPRARLDRATIGRLAALYGLSRLLVGFIVLCSSWLSGGQQSLYGALTKWDAGWYGFISADGYPDFVSPEAAGGNRWAFFPGWPMLLRAAHAAFGGSWQRNGIALAFLLGFVTTLLLYLVVADALGAAVAQRSVLLLLLAPTACVLSMAYTEVLFIPCCVACALFLERRQWELAGAAALLAGATRVAGVALVAACLLYAIAEYRRTREVRPFVAPVIAPLGIVAFFVYQRWQTGHWDAYFTAQTYWDNGNSFGMSIVRSVRSLITDRAAWQYPPNLLVPLCVLLAAAGAIALLRTPRVPISWWIVTVAIGGIAVSPSLSYSIPRLLLPVFPVTVGLAAKVPSRWFPTLAAGSAVLMTVFGVLYFNTVSFQMAP